MEKLKNASLLFFLLFVLLLSPACDGAEVNYGDFSIINIPNCIEDLDITFSQSGKSDVKLRASQMGLGAPGNSGTINVDGDQIPSTFGNAGLELTESIHIVIVLVGRGGECLELPETIEGDFTFVANGPTEVDFDDLD